MSLMSLLSSLIPYGKVVEPPAPPAPKKPKLASEDAPTFKEQLWSVVLAAKEDYPLVKSHLKVGRVVDDTDFLIKAIDEVYKLKFIEQISPIDLIELLNKGGLQCDNLPGLVMNLFPWRTANLMDEEQVNQLSHCLSNLNANLEKVKSKPNHYDWKKISLRNSVALLSCNGIDVVKPLIAQAAKINLLSLEINNGQACDLYIEHVREVLEHSPLERNELANLLERFPPVTFVQAMILASLPNSILSKEDFRKIMREVWENKDHNYKEKARYHLNRYVSSQDGNVTLSTALNDLGDLKSCIMGK